jgi:transcriptional regulator NrdR family protein
MDKHHGIDCPACGSKDTEVVDSRPGPSSIRRRRECDSCGERFTTYEKTPGGQERVFFKLQDLTRFLEKGRPQ